MFTRYFVHFSLDKSAIMALINFNNAPCVCVYVCDNAMPRDIPDYFVILNARTSESFRGRSPHREKIHDYSKNSSRISKHPATDPLSVIA